jgi:hypothetical protein
MKKKKKTIPNWDLIKYRMMTVVENILQERWHVPVALDIYEFSNKLPIKNEKNIDGFVGFFMMNNELYIDFIAVRKHKTKEHKTFIIAHELGHILDFLETGSSGGIEIDSLAIQQDRRIFWECEKRAFSNGYELLKMVRTPAHYLEKFINSRTKSLGFIISKFQNRKKKHVCKHF